MSPREELADGGPLRLARGSQGAATQKGSQLRAGGKAKRNVRKRGPAPEGERRRGAPRGARILRKRMRHDGRLVRRLALHPLDWSRGKRRPRSGGMDDGVPGAAQITRAMALG